MKLKKDNSNIVKTKQSVYEKIAEQFGKDIPVVKNIPRSEQVTHINFKCIGRIANIGDQIATKHPMIKTRSDIHRAAHYLGMSILYHILIDDIGGSNENINQDYNIVIELEKLAVKYQNIYDVTSVIEKIHNAVKYGIIDKQEAKSKIENILDKVPEPDRGAIMDQSKHILDGYGKSIQEIRRWGGRKKLSVVVVPKNSE